MGSIGKGFKQINTFKNLRLIRMLYESPYRIKLYFVCAFAYKKSLKNLTQYEKQRIKSIKDIHKGKRCFIVLTGPSIDEESLKLIKNEICFTVNSGYKMDGIGGWHPDYYVSVDGSDVATEMLDRVVDTIPSVKYVFTDMYYKNADQRVINLPHDDRLLYRFGSFLNMILPRVFTTIKISDDIEKRVYRSKTVLGSCIQIARYMGINEIYLVGADFNYLGEKKHSGLSAEELREEQVDWGKINYEMLFQMNELSIIANKKHIRIYNSTKGGNLEAFPRKQLKEIFK